MAATLGEVAGSLLHVAANDADARQAQYVQDGYEVVDPLVVRAPATAPASTPSDAAGPPPGAAARGATLWEAGAAAAQRAVRPVLEGRAGHVVRPVLEALGLLPSGGHVIQTTALFTIHAEHQMHSWLRRAVGRDALVALAQQERPRWS